MMRTKLLALAALTALALPLAALADTPPVIVPNGTAPPVVVKNGVANGAVVANGAANCAGGCVHGKFGGKWAGLFGAHGALANHPPAVDPHKGKGFFQPPFQAAPWYLYWPYDAHFQLPAPIGAPYYPPQGFSTPWNPYFPAPAMGGGVAVPGFGPIPGGPPPVPGYGPLPPPATPLIPPAK